MGRKPPPPTMRYRWYEQPSYWSYMRKDGEWYYYIDNVARHQTTPVHSPGWVKYQTFSFPTMEEHVRKGKLIEVPDGT